MATAPDRRPGKISPAASAEALVFPPLETFTSDGPMVPDPGTPPIKAEAILASPWPISSRLGLCWLLVRASITRQVFKVSMDSSTARVRAGTTTFSRPCRSLRRRWPSNAVERRRSTPPSPRPSRADQQRIALCPQQGRIGQTLQQITADPRRQGDDRPRVPAGSDAGSEHRRQSPRPHRRLCQFHKGACMASVQAVPEGAPKNLGIWPPMMISPTPQR